MNDMDFQRLRELGWQRKLTKAEEAGLREYLSTHPEAMAEWETDEQLGRLLDGLPEAPPVASNFTALVLAAARREAAAAERPRSRFAWKGWRGWLPRAAVAGLAASLTYLGYQQHQLKARADMARHVAELARAVSASPDLLQNYDHIRRLGDTPPKADTDLLALMK